MSSVPQDYIDAIQRIVRQFLNQANEIRANHIHSNRFIEGLHDQSVEMDNSGNVIIECKAGQFVGIREKP